MPPNVVLEEVIHHRDDEEETNTRARTSPRNRHHHQQQHPMVLSSAATTSTTDHEAPSSFTLALIKSHPRKLMLYWLSCVVKFTFAIIVFAVAINTFVALGDVDELEKYDKALSSKLTAFMVGVSLLHLFTGTVMVIGSVCGIVASLYPGSKPSNVVSDSTGLSIHGSGAAVGDYGQSLGSAVDQANRNLWNPIFISRALKTANLRYYCSIVWLVCSVLTILFQVCVDSAWYYYWRLWHVFSHF